jgi:hypothetical protein
MAGFGDLSLPFGPKPILRTFWVPIDMKFRVLVVDDGQWPANGSGVSWNQPTT